MAVFIILTLGAEIRTARQPLLFMVLLRKDIMSVPHSQYGSLMRWFAVRSDIRILCTDTHAHLAAQILFFLAVIRTKNCTWCVKDLPV